MLFFLFKVFIVNDRRLNLRQLVDVERFLPLTLFWSDFFAIHRVIVVAPQSSALSKLAFTQPPWLGFVTGYEAWQLVIIMHSHILQTDILLGGVWETGAQDVAIVKQVTGLHVSLSFYISYFMSSKFMIYCWVWHLYCFEYSNIADCKQRFTTFRLYSFQSEVENINEGEKKLIFLFSIFFHFLIPNWCITPLKKNTPSISQDHSSVVRNVTFDDFYIFQMLFLPQASSCLTSSTSQPPARASQQLITVTRESDLMGGCSIWYQLTMHPMVFRCDTISSTDLCNYLRKSTGITSKVHK